MWPSKIFNLKATTVTFCVGECSSPTLHGPRQCCLFVAHHVALKESLNFIALHKKPNNL